MKIYIVFCTLVYANVLSAHSTNLFVNDKDSKSRLTYKIELENVDKTSSLLDYWGTVEGNSVGWLIKSSSIKVDGIIVKQPASLFSDFSNINEVTLLDSKFGYKLVLIGGDGAATYKAEISFDSNGWPLKKKVLHGGFPGEVWQETSYSFIRVDDGR